MKTPAKVPGQPGQAGLKSTVTHDRKPNTRTN
jgi:hypothetical protein